MGHILKTVTSSSNPGKHYEITMGNDGVTYCTCMAWKMRKTCKHLDAYLYGNVKPHPHSKPTEKRSSLEQIIQQEVDHLTS